MLPLAPLSRNESGTSRRSASFQLKNFRSSVPFATGSCRSTLAKNEISGYRFEDMPDDRDAYRLGIQAIELTAQSKYGKSFPELPPIKQDTILKSIHDGEKWAAHDIWERMSIDRFWHLLVQDCVAAYYAHPWAWDEIGYGGPAYPRAYTRLEGGLPEPWEVDEQRYGWKAPESSLSDVYEESGAGSGTPAHGQGGTH
jgi:hypothetical protein